MPDTHDSNQRTDPKIQKILARAGFGSRRKCEQLIAAGRVKVNGAVAKLGDRANPDRDEITVDGRPAKLSETVYIKLNKPRGVISSTEDELRQDRLTIRDLVNIPGHLFPIGRLDKQSEGLILLTNDGQMAHRLTHPRFEHEKKYEVTLEGLLSDEAIHKWQQGVMLDGRMTAVATINVQERSNGRTILEITLREGRKRQIRRIAAAFGHPVISLVRRSIGPVKLGNLPSGSWVALTREEIRMLRSAIMESNDPNRAD